ncbi:ARM repeat-containing protein [Epithele typhae]|uniref:ARM repeat-containing protein n=1 Tax=Epithele typhae TaxID=378194 RepID=UPI00200750CE|nr:ARM repeat-containing protein [Epithele typhae]KAH9922790.1 ARM repeat-containing protein [Epithele typhae]
MDPTEDIEEHKQHARFENKDEFVALRDQLFALDIHETEAPDDGHMVMQKLVNIFSSYQEQPYLWDPYLEDLLAPAVNRLKDHVIEFHKDPNRKINTLRMRMFSEFLYNFMKLRGYKTLTRFFPHEISDLSITLDYITSPESPAERVDAWALRYIILLWLSLVCMIPFDLEQFDEVGKAGETASRIEQVGKQYLTRAGIDREGAAILLSRFYMRRPMGICRALCEVTKLGSAEQVKDHRGLLLSFSGILESNESLMGNTIIRKFRTKLVSRTVIRLLPAKTRRLRAKGRALADEHGADSEDVFEEDDFEAPEEVETVLEDLFKALRDKDTIVRYSAAKSIARISERLPADFAEQVLEQVMHLFTIHSAAIASLYDMPSIAEATWHGACLACAEMARRGLIPDERLAELIGWLGKALYFDIRKGAHSIGSNVRDATSYVLWSLARAQSIDALRPHALGLARQLVIVSLFDREVHIRRAASAAFQEYVGRTSLFPHGIDVLRKTDFYAVGIRKNAFLVAAPEVAVHDEYRDELVNHLINVTLRHWDPAMRQMAAQSLSAICQLDLVNLGPAAATRMIHLLHPRSDPGDIHGALLALTELGSAFHGSPFKEQLEPERRKLFSALSNVPLTLIKSVRQDLVAAAACQLIAAAISTSETQHNHTSVPFWRQVVDTGLRSKTQTVQEAAAVALAAVSHLVNCSAVLERLVKEFEKGTSHMQQSLARVLGVLDYAAYPHGVQAAVQCLLRMVDRKGGTASADIEARRNAFSAMPLILSTVSGDLLSHLPPALVCAMTDALLNGLTDYYSDERGDVGSWARMACVRALTAFARTLCPCAPALPLAAYFPPERFHDALGGIIKQGVERLDNVRQAAGECVSELLVLPPPAEADPGPWKIRCEEKMKRLLLDEKELPQWSNGAWLFPRAVQVLDIERYRAQVLAGIVLSVNTKTDSTQRPVTSALVGWASKLPVATYEPDRYDLRGLVRDLLAQAMVNTASNAAVIPVIQTFNVLLEADVFEELQHDVEGLKTIRSLHNLVTRNASRLKLPQRINVSMKCLVNLLTLSEVQKECIKPLEAYINHQYPRIRIETAEYLYLTLSSRETGMETEDVEEILLETEWGLKEEPGGTSVSQAANKCLALLAEKLPT